MVLIVLIPFKIAQFGSYQDATNEEEIGLLGLCVKSGFPQAIPQPVCSSLPKLHYSLKALFFLHFIPG